MKSLLALTFLTVSLTNSLFSLEAGSQSVSNAEDEVKKLEREWLDAYEKNDAEAMNRIVADGFIITFPNGALQTKSQLMTGLKAPRQPGQPEMRFHTEDVKSQSYGDTVILYGRVVTEYQREGKAVKEQARYTDTYVKRDNRWQVVASHLSNVAEPKQK